MRQRIGRRLISIMLSLLMLVSLLPTAVFAEELQNQATAGVTEQVGEGTGNTVEDSNENEDSTGGEETKGESSTPYVAKVGGNEYAKLEAAIAAAEPDANGIITYEIYGKATVDSTGWVQVAKTGLTGPSKVEFVGKTEDAEICITGDLAILADQSYDIDVSFDGLTLSKLNPAYGGDYGHSTNYFTCWLRNNNQAENTVTYTNCTFPNGACNNQYGKTVFDNCEFKNAASGKYNLWNYGGSTEIKGSTFTGTRGIKTYNEGTLAVAPTVKIENTTFGGLTEKAAIVVSKATDVTLAGITATGCTEGLLQKDIEGGSLKTTIEANGTGISGEFNITATTTEAAAKEEFNITAGTFDSEVSKDYLTAGLELKPNEDGTYGVEAAKVASVGGVVYPTLKAAFAALSAENHTLTLIKADAWAESTPVYWKAGEQSGYAAKLTDALTAAYMANAGDITIVCRPGANVGEMTHGHVADNITIYGNDAYISGGECDLEVDTYMFSRETGKQDTTNGEYLTKDITINAYELDNLGVWGQRNTSHTINVNLTDCDGKAIEGKENVQRVYISNNSGVTSSVNNITLTGCNFLTANTAVYSNANGMIIVDGCSFTGSKAPVNINHDGDGAVTVEVKNSTFTNCGDKGEWKNFAAPIRFVNSGSGTMKTTVDSCTFEGTVGKNGDILIGDGRAGKVSNDLSLTVKNTYGWVQAQKPGRYGDIKPDSGKRVETEVEKDVGLTTSIKSAFIKDTTGTRSDPYTLEQLSEMTRAEYIDAQKRLGDTMYVAVGNYEYDTNGVLGNGVRNDTPGQVPDHSKLNSYAENGYLGEGNDGANGKNIVFVNGSITSNVYGYTDIDRIGTSLLLAVPAYTNVTFEGITFNNVMSFDYQLYTSPWSQLGELKFENCVFEGVIVGAIAAQELTFDGCRFEDYENSKSENNSNPTWIRPAYGNWTKDDNEGQGTGFRSLTRITFTNNTVTSTRPVKFERIAQWEMDTTVTATGNTFTINKVQGDTSTKNVGMYFGANAKFDLVVDNNTAKGKTAGLYTAVYSAPNGKSYAGLPAGSTVKDASGNNIEEGVPALEWKSTKPLTLKTTEEVAQLTTTKGVVVKFATLQEAINAAANGETVTLLLDETVTTAISVTGKSITLDLNGKTLSSSVNGITVAAGAGLTVKDSSENEKGKVVATGRYSNGIENAGTLTIESGSFEAVYGAVRALGGSTTTINGGTFSSSNGQYGMYYWANKVALSVTVNGGTFKNSVSTAMENGKVTLKVNGGSFATDLSAYCPVDCGTFLSEESGLYEFGKDADHTPAGYEVDTNGNVTISTEDGLFWFARQVNLRGQTFKDKTVKLDNDITLTKAWEPVGVSVQKSFQGTFDGNGHSISGMKVVGGYQKYGYGFFKLVISATVKNLTIENANVTGSYSNVVGIVTGYSYGSSTFENVHVKNSAVYAFGKVGGMVGMAEDAGATTTFRNCSVTGTTIHVGYNGAGFCGLLMGKCNITGSYLAENNVIIDENSQGFGVVTELDTTVACDGSVSTCAGNGTVIKGKYLPRSGYYWSAYSDLYNHYGASSHDCTLADGKMLANSEVVHDAPVAIGEVKYSDLQAAFDAAKTGDTVTLLDDITLTEQVNITKALDGLTLDGNGKTITCATTTDPLASGGSALYFGNAADHLYCTGIKIKDLTMTGTARFAIFLCGGTSTEFSNVNISGNYYIAVNLYGTHGAIITNCNISNSTTGTDRYISGVWSNVSSANPLKLVSSKVDVIAINTYTTANKLEPKIFIDKDSSAEVHTFDTGSVSKDKRLCVSPESEGTYSIKEYDDTTSKWVDIRFAEVDGSYYGSLQEAVNAAKSGSTVKLLNSTKENITISKKLTLDLNGFTLNGGTVKGKAALKVDNASVTVKDSSTDKSGTIMREDTAENSGVSSHYVIDIQGKYGFLKFESGNVVNNSGNTAGKGASLIRLGDDSNMSANPTLTIKGGTFTQDNFIAIKVDFGTLHFVDGTVTSANSYAIENWNNAYVKGGTVNGTVSSWVYSTGVAFSKLEIRGGTVNGDVASVNYDNAADKQARIYVTGGEVTGTLGTYTYSNGLVPTEDTSMATIEVTGGTFDKDPAKYVTEDAKAVKNSDGKYGVERVALAKIGDTEYLTMDKAFHAVKDGGTITLLRNYTTNAVQNSGSKSFAIDLNGHTWTYTGTDTDCAAFEINYSNVTLTVKNGTVVSGSMVGLIPTAGSIKYDNAGLVFENVEMTANGHSGIETNGGNTNDTVTLKNSTLNVPNGYGIYFPSSGKLTIDNSTINAKTMGVQVCAGSLSVSGEKTKITVTGDAVTKTENDGAIEDGAAISIVNRTGYKGLDTVTISEGTFVAKPGNKAIKAYDWANKSESEFTQGEKVTIAEEKVLSSSADTGVTPTAGTAWVLVPGEKVLYAIRQISDCEAEINGTYYLKLQDAIDAANSRDTVELVKDVDLTQTVVVNKTITLDMGGKKLFNTADLWDNPNKEAANWSLISVREGGDLTITGNGTFAAKKNDCYAVDVQDGAKLVIKDGTFVGNIHAVYVFEGTATIDGGTYSVQQKYPDESKAYEFVLNCYDANRANGTAKIIVNGGTFQNFDPMNNQAEGVGTSFVAAGVGVDHVDGKFTAKSGMIAQVVDADGKSVKAFDKLSDALAAAEAEQTVKLLNNVANETFVMVKAGVTLDLAGKDITGATMLYVTGTIVDTAASATKGAVSAEAYMIASSVGSGYTPIYSGTGYQFYKLGMNIMTKDVSADGATVIFAPKTKNEWTAELNAFRTLLAPGFDTSKVQIVLEVEWGETNTHDSQRFAFNDQYVYKYATEDSWAFSVTMNGLNALSGKVTATAKIITYGADGREMTWLSSDAVTLKGE